MTSRSGHRQRSLNGRHEYAPTALAVLGHSCGQDADSDRKVPSPSIKINRAAASGLNWRPILWVPHARMTGRNIGRQPRRTPSATFTVKEIADRLSAGLIRFDHSLAFVSVHAALGYCVSLFGVLHSGHRLAKPGLSGFSSNSSEQTVQTLIGNTIQFMI